VTLVAEPVHVGRTTIVIQTDVRRADGKLAGRVVALMFIVAFFAWGTGFYGLGLYVRELHGWTLGAPVGC